MSLSSNIVAKYRKLLLCLNQYGDSGQYIRTSTVANGNPGQDFLFRLLSLNADKLQKVMKQWALILRLHVSLCLLSAALKAYVLPACK